MRLELKPGVRVGGIAPEMVLGALVIAGVYEMAGADVLTITSCRDGQHSPNSLHYVGKALDFRTWNLPDEAVRLEIAASAREALGGDFDVVLEDDHLHVEFYPA